MTTLSPVGVVAGPIVVAALLLVCGRWLPRPVVDGVAILTTAAVGVSGAFLTPGAVTAGGWPAGVGIPLVVDGASRVLVTLVGTLATVALLFSWRYFSDVEAHFQGLVLLFVAGLGGFALSGDLFDMLVFFELMGACGFALAAYKIEEARSLQGGLTFGIVNSLGAYLTLCGIGLLYARTGTLGLAPLGAAHLPADTATVAAFVLVSTGWLVKAAVVPFHFWLADAHAVAPTPVCVLFSGVMAPLGVYGLARVHAVVFGALDVTVALTVLGLVTAVLGAVMCVLQRNVKRLLAYSTIAHIGTFVVAVAVSSPEASAGWLTDVVGHAGVKGALFLLVGVLLARHGSVDEIELGGSCRRSRGIAALMALGGLALAGLPPFGSALGKGLIEQAVPVPVAVVLTLVAVLTGAAVLRVALRLVGIGPLPADRADDVRTTGEGEERETRRLERLPVTMLAGPVLLLGGSLAVGLLTPGVLGAAGTALVDGAGYRDLVLGGVPPTTPPAEVAWSASGLVVGTAAAVVAVLLALGAVYAGRLPTVLRRRVPRQNRAVLGLERLHSGHVGDYVAWVFVGITALGALVLLG
ncbi:complex I subunit 5 family protein [Actinomycetospora chiangmaiensis]|uniref:complex I subunit 5 family protein n=1 Tax=Actinomycetospora chiangmaiensis TaxID=402650 RepID=UPI00037FAC0B|nr:complex I subunit 5 family protein [Actinomycetospora chiangmaiensis]